jgi:lipid-A-disaccharide synthase
MEFAAGSIRGICETDMLRIGIVAGEVSGDALGADLINNIRQRIPEACFEGIGGPLMTAAGCSSLFPMEKLSVMGLLEVLEKYRELSGIRNNLTRYFLEHPPDLFIGIDAPDFNLELERRLHQGKIRTVHYVSPQVWAWREYRLKKIARAVDLMLVLFPFEKDYYDRHGIPAVYAGHPLADKIALTSDTNAARERLNLPQQGSIIALMPGSRRMELRRLMEPFLQAADRYYSRRKQTRFITSLLDTAAIDLLKQTLARLKLEHLPLTIFQDKSHDVLEAADQVLMASGTITLEAMLFKKPMVVAYKMNWLTYRIVRSLIRIKYAALPNILADARLVPECLQADCNPGRLAQEMLHWSDDDNAVADLQFRFTELHRQMMSGPEHAAVAAVMKFLGAV